MEATIRIKGHVQGVFFRASGEKEAIKNNLKGWIKNESDGSVSAHVQGEKEDIEKFFQWCKTGPTRAEVSSAEITWIESTNNEHLEFEVQ